MASLTSDQVTKLATDAATSVYNRLSTQVGVAKIGVHKHNGHDTTQISFNDLTDTSNVVTSVTATSPLVSTGGTTPVISINASALVPTGSIIMYGGAYSSVPTGYLLCDGNSYDPTIYPTLFAVIGYTYGTGAGSNFCVPYFSGRVPIGDGGITGQGGGTSGVAGVRPTGGSTLTAAPAGSWKGEETHVLTVGELAQHTHDQVITSGAGGGGVVGPTQVNQSTLIDSGVPTIAAGSNNPHNTIQPVLSVNFLIKT